MVNRLEPIIAGRTLRKELAVEHHFLENSFGDFEFVGGVGQHWGWTINRYLLEGGGCCGDDCGSGGCCRVGIAVDGHGRVEGVMRL